MSLLFGFEELSLAIYVYHESWSLAIYVTMGCLSSITSIDLFLAVDNQSGAAHQLIPNFWVVSG